MPGEKITNKAEALINNPKDRGLEALVRRVIDFSLLIVILGLISVVLFGISSLNIKEDISRDESFIKVAEEIRPDFENSLRLYTGDTQKIIDFLLKLRPQSEEDFITFITTLEKLGKNLSLNLGIRTLELKDKKTDSVNYDISFYGSIEDLKSFVTELDKIPYYIRISNIKYTNPAVEERDDGKHVKTPNVLLGLQLFTKEKNAN